MIRNKMLRLVLFNLLLIAIDIISVVIWCLTMYGIFANSPLRNAGLGGVVLIVYAMILELFFLSFRRGIFNRLLIHKTWIPNAVYVIESFVALYLLYGRSSDLLLHSIIAALLCGAISSGASLITWAIQCKVQKKRAAKQAVNWED